MNVWIFYEKENEVLFKHFGSEAKESPKLAAYLYNSTYSFILSKILTHPPEWRDSVEYYKKAFEKLELEFRL